MHIEDHVYRVLDAVIVSGEDVSPEMVKRIFTYVGEDDLSSDTVSLDWASALAELVVHHPLYAGALAYARAEMAGDLPAHPTPDEFWDRVDRVDGDDPEAVAVDLITEIYGAMAPAVMALLADGSAENFLLG